MRVGRRELRVESEGARVEEADEGRGVRVGGCELSESGELKASPPPTPDFNVDVADGLQACPVGCAGRATRRRV